MSRVAFEKFYDSLVAEPEESPETTDPFLALRGLRLPPVRNEPVVDFVPPSFGARLASLQTGKELFKSLGRSFTMPTARIFGGVAAGAALTEHSLDAVANQTPAPSATKLFAFTARQTKRASTAASRWLDNWTQETLGTDPNYYDINQESYNKTTLEMMHNPKFWVTQVPEMAGSFITPFGSAMVVRAAIMKMMPKGLNAAQTVAFVQSADMVATRAGFATSVAEAMGGAYNERLDYLTTVHSMPQATAERIAASSALVEGAAIGLIGYTPFSKVARQLMGRAGKGAFAAIALEGGSEVTQEAVSILNQAITYRLATGDTRYTPTVETMTNGDAIGQMILAGIVGTGTPAVIIGGRKLYDYTTGKAMEASVKRNMENMPLRVLRHIEQNTEGPARQLAIEALEARTAEVETDSTPRPIVERVDTMEQFLESEIMADIDTRKESISDMAFMALTYAEQSGITLDAAAEAIVAGTALVTDGPLNLEAADVRYHAEQLAEAKDGGQLFRAYHRMKRMEDHWRKFTPEQAAFRVGLGQLNLTDYNANEGLTPAARTQIEVTRARQAVARLATDIADVRQRIREARAAKDTDADSLTAMELRLGYLLEQERGLGNVRDAMLTLVETVIGERTPIESDAPRRAGRKIAELLNAQDTQRVLRLLRGDRIKTAKRMQTALARLETIVRDAYSREQRVQAARLSKKIGRPSPDAPRLPEWNELRGFARAIAALNSRKAPRPFDGDSLIAAVESMYRDTDPMLTDYANSIIRQVELAVEADNQIDPDTHADALALARSLEKASSKQARGVQRAENAERDKLTKAFRDSLQGIFKVEENAPAKPSQNPVRQLISALAGRTAILFPRTMAKYMLGPQGVEIVDRLNTGRVLRLGVMQKFRRKMVDYGEQIGYDFTSEEAMLSGEETAAGVIGKHFGMRGKPRLVAIEGTGPGGNPTKIDLTVQELMSIWALHATNRTIAKDGIKLRRNNVAVKFADRQFDAILALRNDFKKEALLVEKGMELLQSDIRPLLDQFMIGTFGFTNSRDNYYPTMRSEVFDKNGALVDNPDIEADTLGITDRESVGSKMMNSGIMIDRTPNNSTFVVGEFWRVLEDHAWKVASLRHIANDLGRLNTATQAVGDLMDAALGSRFRDFWTRWIKEIDREGAGGQLQTTPSDRFMTGMVRRASAGYLSWRPQVALYQLASLVTAFSYKPELIGGYLVSTDIRASEIIRGMPDLIDREHAGGAAIYNANTQVGGSRSSSIIKRADMSDISLIQIHWMDKVAIRSIIRAVSGHIERSMRGATREQKIAAIREMTRDVVNRTQATYDIMNVAGRTFQHRGNPAFKAIVGMFRSDLDKHMNLIAEAWIDASRDGTRESYQRAIRHTIVVGMGTSFIVSLIAALFKEGFKTMMGGDFDEDKFVASVMERGTTGAFGVVPLAGDGAALAYDILTQNQRGPHDMIQSPAFRLANDTVKSFNTLANKTVNSDADFEDAVRAIGLANQLMGNPGSGFVQDLINGKRAADRQGGRGKSERIIP